MDRGEPAVTLEMASSQAHGRSPGAACMALPVSLVPCPSGDRLRVGRQDAATGSCEAGQLGVSTCQYGAPSAGCWGLTGTWGGALSHPFLLWSCEALGTDKGQEPWLWALEPPVPGQPAEGRSVATAVD